MLLNYIERIFLCERNFFMNKSSVQSFDQDEQIVEKYWQRDQNAIQETHQKYGPMLRKVAYNILCDAEDCEECQNDTYLKIWNAIPTTRPTSFPAFIVQIMRHIAINRYKAKSRKKRIPSQLMTSLEELEALGSGASVEGMWEAKELGELITVFVENLNERQRYLFVDRYYLAESIEKTAADLSISTQVAYKELRKIKQGLKEYLERNGVQV